MPLAEVIGFNYVWSEIFLDKCTHTLVADALGCHCVNTNSDNLVKGNFKESRYGKNKFCGLYNFNFYV